MMATGLGLMAMSLVYTPVVNRIKATYTTAMAIRHGDVSTQSLYTGTVRHVSTHITMVSCSTNRWGLCFLEAKIWYILFFTPPYDISLPAVECVISSWCKFLWFVCSQLISQRNMCVTLYVCGFLRLCTHMYSYVTNQLLLLSLDIVHGSDATAAVLY